MVGGPHRHFLLALPRGKGRGKTEAFLSPPRYPRHLRAHLLMVPTTQVWRMEEEGEVGCGQEGTSILPVRTGEAVPGSGDVGAERQGLDRAGTRMRPGRGQGGPGTGIKAGTGPRHVSTPS